MDVQKYPKWKETKSWRNPFSTSMIVEENESFKSMHQTSEKIDTNHFGR